MTEIFAQVFSNLRANKLRSFLTMFGILWGVISVVILSATGEGFRRGNQHVLEELGKNIAIVWGSRTSMQAGGQRAGRQIYLTSDDARALASESSLIEVVSPELLRGGINVKSAYNAAALQGRASSRSTSRSGRSTSSAGERSASATRRGRSASPSSARIPPSSCSGRATASGRRWS